VIFFEKGPKYKKFRRYLDAAHILELLAEKKQLQKELTEQKERLAATMRSREAAFASEDHLRGRFQDLVLAYNDLEDYSNELHEEVHQLYYQLHPNDASGAVEAEGGVVLADGGEPDADLEDGVVPM
jgi:predicted nuclease with TOPRIM domain